MKPAPFQYMAPASLKEALGMLAEQPLESKLIAGGQSLVPLMNFRLARPERLIDIGRLSELRVMRQDGDTLVLGAGTRHRDLIENPEVRRRLPILSMAAEQIAHRAIRSRGTLGGSIAHADPTAELPACAVACDAEIVVVSAGGERRIAAQDFFVTYLTTALEPDEIIREVVFPAPAGRRYAFREYARRPGDFAIVAVAGVADGDQAVLAFAGVGGTPARAEIDISRADAMLESAVAELEPDADVHASADYRCALALELGRKVLADLKGDAK